LTKRLGELEFKDYDTLESRYKLIDQTIAEFDSGLPSPRPVIHGEIRSVIDRCFAKDSPLEIIEELEKSKSQSEEVRAWADKTIKTIEERSPIGVAVTLQTLRDGKKWTISQAFQNELEIAGQFMQHPDFVTGVTARLIERIKDRPNWQPNTLKDVSAENLAPFFKKINRGGESLQLLHTGKEASYSTYPHAWLSLPTEKQILAVAKTESPEGVLQHFLEKTKHKLGVKEKVTEVLERAEKYRG
jgi:3-hydroxyisobutyryl-CoA hydrolase